MLFCIHLRRHSGSRFLSILYALILVLIGVTFPVSEALLGVWRRSTSVSVSNCDSNLPLAQLNIML